MKYGKLIWVIGLLCLLFLALSAYFFLTRGTTPGYVKTVSYDQLYAPANNGPAGIEKWKGMDRKYDPAEVAKGKQLLALDSVIRENDSTLTKMIRIGSWLKRTYRNCPLGKPEASFSQLPLTAQHAIARQGGTSLWCGNFASHFLFFTSISGITCRYIQVVGKDSHVFTECYLPESRQWVLTDLTFDVIYATDHKGSPLNGVDLLMRNNESDSSAITLFGQDSLPAHSITGRTGKSSLWNLYLKNDTWLNYYYPVTSREAYAPAQRVKRYVLPAAWFETFTLLPVSNTVFYLRIISLYTGIVLVVIFFILIYLKRK